MYEYWGKRKKPTPGQLGSGGGREERGLLRVGKPDSGENKRGGFLRRKQFSSGKGEGVRDWKKV